MKFVPRVIVVVGVFIAVALSGCAWGPCGPVFTGRSSATEEARKVELRKNADAVRAAASKPDAPKQ
jgi:hypothetical protein